MIHSSELKAEMVSLVDSVLGRLEDEVYKSLEYATPEGISKKELRPAARNLTLEFLSNLPRVRELLRTACRGDLQREIRPRSARRRSSWRIRSWKPSRCNAWLMNFTSNTSP